MTHGNIPTRHDNRLMVLAVVLMAIVGSMAVLDASSDETDGYDQWGNAWWSSTPSHSGIISGTDTSGGNGTHVTVPVGGTATYYYCTPQYASSTLYFDPSTVSGLSYTYQFYTNFNYSGTQYYAFKVVVTGESITSNAYLKVTAKADWLAGNDAARLNVDVIENSRTVTLHPEGGSVSPTTITVVSGQPVGTLPTPTKAGYTFAGWFTAATGGTQITASDTLSGIIYDLYAHWNAVQTYRVTFNANGGSVSPTYKDVAVGGTYGDLPTPTKSYSTFDGWYTSATGGNRIQSSTTVSLTSNTTLYAHWSPWTFTFSAESAGINDGDVSPSYHQNVLSVDDLPITFTATPNEGYQFTNQWAFTGATVTHTGSTFTLTKDMITRDGGTYYVAAIFEGTYTYSTVNLTVGDGIDHIVLSWKRTSSSSSWSSMTYYNSTSVTNKVPVGWYVRIYAVPENGYTTEYTSSSPYTYTATSTAKNFSATGTIIDYTVSFVAGAGGSVNKSSITAHYGDAITYSGNTLTLNGTTVTATADSGYSFFKWSSTPSTVTGSITLTASFSTTGKTITFDARGGDVYPSSKTVTVGGTYGDLPTPTRTGHDFNGWYTSSTGGTHITSSSTVSSGSTQTLYAHWTAQTYTITFMVVDPDATVSPATKQVTYGQTYGTLPTPTNPGFTFGGWVLAGNVPITASSTVTITQDSNVFAVWNHETFTMTLNANGGTVSPSSVQVYHLQTWSTLDLPTPTRDGPYSFRGWALDPNGIPLDPSYQIQKTAAFTVYAIWGGEAYTVTFNGNGGTDVTPTTKTVYYGSPYGSPMPTATYPGYTLAGWFTAATGGTEVTSETIVTEDAEDQILYAHWTAATYRVALDANGGTVSPFYHYVTYGQPFGDIPTPTKDGSAFEGWYDSDGNLVTSTTTMTYTSDISLTARWDDSVLVEFDANGGTVSTLSKFYTAGEPYGDLPDPLWTGHDFLGWYTAASGGTVVQESDTVTEGDKTLYAHWSGWNFSITTGVSTEGSGTVTPSYHETELSVDDLPISFSVTANEGYDFNGQWEWNGTTYEGETFYLTSDMLTGADRYTLVAMLIQETTYSSLRIVVGDGIQMVYYSWENETDSGNGNTAGTITVSNQIPVGATVKVWATAYPGWTYREYTEDNPFTYTATNAMKTVNISAYYGDKVWWDNKYVNGKVSIAFSYPEMNDACEHTMEIPLYQYDGVREDGDGVKDFSQSAYKLKIKITYPRTTVECTLINGSSVVSTVSKVLGTWPQFVVTIDAQKSTVDVSQIKTTIGNTTFSFTGYTTYPPTAVFDYSSKINGMAVSKIYHKDSDNENHPRFQVVGTETYLDTYGFVMTDPVLNVVDKFPNYDNLRLNFYAFAMYGDSMTVNGWTFNLQGSSITNLYYKEVQMEDGTKRLYAATAGTADAIKADATLTNVYVTWTNIGSTHTTEDRQCYLTFVDKNLTIYLGTFNPANLTVSFEGVWYFTTSLYEPYNTTETTYEMNWNSWFNMDGNTFLICFLGLIIAAMVAIHVLWRPLQLLDFIVIGGAGILIYTFIGGF